MPNWDSLGYLAYALIWIAAIIQAIEEGCKKAPAMMEKLSTYLPSFLSSPIWSFIPLILLLLSGTIFLSRELGWIGHSSANGDVSAFVYNPERELETIYQRQYKNETVYLDGKKFVDCTFDNVTFIYKGTAPVELHDAHFTLAGGVRLTSPNPAINEILTLMNSLSKIKPMGDGSVISPEKMNELLNKPK